MQKLVGTTTFGKGTVQRQAQDGVDKSYLKYTFAKWYSPLNVNIHKIGIEPDYDVKLSEIFYADYFELEDDILEYDVVSDAVYVQKALKFLGYHGGRTDAYFDLDTRNALHKYKQDRGLSVNDTINQDVIKSVYSSVIKEWSNNKKVHDTIIIKH